jgi:hypothetical protein
VELATAWSATAVRMAVAAALNQAPGTVVTFPNAGVIRNLEPVFRTVFRY